tara:strand:- start:220 stop:1149 length:930 start_codon:yes stop_codon:yes gene_type:complete
MVSKLNSTSKKILEEANNGKIFLLDGATGTFLQENGLEPGGSPELMNIEKPDVIQNMADTYFASGSDIVLTNTFGGNYFRMKHYGLENQVIEINKQSAQIAKSVSKKYKDKYVFGSIGPTGEFIEPLGNVTESEMYDALLEQMKGLYEGGVDGFMIETQIATEETLMAIKVARENFDILVFASMVYDKGPRGFFTMFGLEPEKSLDLLYETGADVVGTNCGNGSEKMIEISEIFRKSTDKPLLVQANAGIPSIKKNSIIYPETPEDMAKNYKRLIDLKINFLGGCCGCSTNHISSFSEIIRSHNECISG